MTGIPEEAGPALLNEIVNSVSSKEQPSEFTIQGYKSKARSLMKTDAFNSYIILGIIGSLERNPHEMRENHSKALNINPHDMIAVGNFAVSLHRLGYFDEAYKHMQYANEVCQGSDPFTVAKLALYSLCNGFISEALDAYNHLLKLKSEYEFGGNRLFEDLEKFNSNHELDDRKTNILLRTVQNILNLNEIYYFNIDTSVNHDENSSWLSWVIDTNLNPEEVMELNVTLSTQLADLELSDIQDNVVARFQ